MTTKPVLEPAAQEFADATADPPYLFDLGPDKGRETVDEVQSGEIARPDVDITDITVPGGPSGAVSVRILSVRRPSGSRPEVRTPGTAGSITHLVRRDAILVAFRSVLTVRPCAR